MTLRSLSFVSGLVLATAVIGSVVVAPATAKKPPKPPPSPPPTASWTTYVKDFTDVIDGVKCDVTPEVGQATSDGGSVALALSSRPSASASESCAGVNWLIKLDSSGSPRWQEAVGCFNLPPGSYSYGVSLLQTADGGDVIGGPAIGSGARTRGPHVCGDPCGVCEKRR